jgi:4-amino-4-deoxy-L-arabinose transferase-like glycosyltransferase
MKFMKSASKRPLQFFWSNKTKIFLILLTVAFIFLRFYELLERADLGWDQADSAWAAKSILIDNPLRFEGVPIKGNTSIYMGPLYYYLIAPFYYFSNLDIVASPIFAGVISLISFVVFFTISKKLFNTNIALIALFLYTFSYEIITFDRVQAAYVLIPTLSYVVFFFLYKVITGHEKYILALAAAVGFGFHVSITSIFYPMIILFTLPFFPKTKKTIAYLLIGLLLFFLFLSPMPYAMFYAKQPTSNNFTNYFNTYYHGLHLRRLLQLLNDAFISIADLIHYQVLRPLAFVIPPLFIFLFSFQKRSRKRLLFSYMVCLWVVVPWVVLATFSGELTEYYFSLPRDIALVMMAFLLASLYTKRHFVLKGLTAVILISYALYNLYLCSQSPYGNFFPLKAMVNETIRNKQIMQFKDRDPSFYIYYVSTRHNKAK